VRLIAIGFLILLFFLSSSLINDFSFTISPPPARANVFLQSASVP